MGDSKSSGKPPEEDPIAALLAGGGVICYTGLVARSLREGYWLIYPCLDKSLSVEVRQEDIVHTEHLPPERSPFGSLGGSRVFVRKGSMVTITRTRSSTQQAGQATDEFDLDLRFAARAQTGGGGDTPTAFINTCDADCGGFDPGTDNTCFACTLDFFACAGTDQSCFNTCQATCIGTCQQCGPTGILACMKTHNTCNQATCHTCGVRCAMVTRVTCQQCKFYPGTATCGATCAQGCIP